MNFLTADFLSLLAQTELKTVSAIGDGTWDY